MRGLLALLVALASAGCASSRGYNLVHVGTKWPTRVFQQDDQFNEHVCEETLSQIDDYSWRVYYAAPCDVWVEFHLIGERKKL